MTKLLAGIGLDSSLVPLQHGGLSLIQTTDFFYPLVDSPYIMVCLLISCTWSLCCFACY